MGGWMDACMHACKEIDAMPCAYIHTLHYFTFTLTLTLTLHTYIHYITLHLHLHYITYIHTYKHYIYIPICNISTPAAPLGTDPPRTGQEVCPLRLR